MSGTPDKIAHLIGGGPGSGKTRLALELAQEQPGAVHINVDDLRATLPEYQRMQIEGDPDAVKKANPAARRLVKQALNDAIENGRDLIYDDPMGGYQSQRVALVKRLQDADYNVTVSGVETPVRVARRQAAQRAEESPRPGDAGRPVVPQLESVHQAAAANTLAMMGAADRARVYGHRPGGPVLAWERVGSGAPTVYDQGVYDAFQAKAEGGSILGARPGRGPGPGSTGGGEAPDGGGSGAI